jgi:hypothetical protein
MDYKPELHMLPATGVPIVSPTTVALLHGKHTSVGTVTTAAQGDTLRVLTKLKMISVQFLNGLFIG